MKTLKDMSKVSTIAKLWIKELGSRGIKRFVYRDLPKDLQDRSAHRKAQECGLIIRVGKETEWTSIWEIK